MGIRVALEHRTTYHFDRLVDVYPHVIRLRPAPHARTPIEAYTLKIGGGEHFLNWQQDAFGNYLARLVFTEKMRTLDITVGLVADMEPVNPLDFFVEEFAEMAKFEYPKDLLEDLEPYLRPVSGSDDVWAWADRFTRRADQRTIDFLVELNHAIRADVDYSVRMEPGVQTPDHTLNSGIGSCRDSAWMLVSALRHLGLAARFVSGYLIQLTADEKALDGPSGPLADFTDLHAWVEVYIPGAGWIGLDPTSGLFAAEGHIPLSATPHPTSAAAISGATGKCEATLTFSNTVRRIHEDPRVTLPYTEKQWARIVELGAKVDARLADGDVRLTMGGEPTFVSIDHRDEPEWMTEADGPTKRVRASDLAERLRQTFAPGGLVQRSQGKWYPGEPLPRWQIAIMWRTDGSALWSDPSLLADPWSGAEAHATNDDALRVAEAVSKAFGLSFDAVQPAFEDPLARLARLVRLPAGPPPDEPRKLSIAELDASVDSPTAFVLPLHRIAGGWESVPWRMRRGRIVLTEGDSPAGLRLPLDAIAWDPAEATPEQDPTVRRGPLPTNSQPVAHMSKEVSITAVVVEMRDGIVHVFLPPLPDLAGFVELVGVVEGAAAQQGVPVVVEGYGPPSDSRLQSITVTPDPGVIEVNVQPAASFAEQCEILETLYEQARLARLSTEGFDVDGSHGGTGGGNHITLGGPTPWDSPLLRRPDLLVSLLTYWQRHPSLSYLFSGRFIGPTSQAPRVDEGRPEKVYELEIAFAELARLAGRSHSGEAAPWQVDRALRHLLTDLTGNTHRAEFCIDKLYSPDSSRGRLGLLELRGFEMPPHYRMAMVQALLVRSLVARFWDEPLHAPLIEHGSNLHGRYLLPHYVINDIADVAADLRQHGIDFPTSWLDPFTEFRFPRIGTAVVAGVEIELRSAIEPWHVLGEEATGTGTARFVDSSVERLQVRVAGADQRRFAVTVNGIPIPLQATDKADVQVAGIRYRAWQPPSALHPSIEVHSPLVFDVVDLGQGVSRGGCTYHVVHPGGRAYEDSPVNAVAAASRRNRRFDSIGYTSGEVDVSRLREIQARIATDISAPGILDLRRVYAVLR
ncbi:DUF2126 domain-containing protein [Smaragdicoccus niigatensis]|uniref:transglutaminase family protein n=1 Tax=Smaragdicoccus niigatensis TaxID=359359 RepID=UPI0003719960|nr:transglutaminase family protein [Smaragdicoccus niigatensis]